MRTVKEITADIATTAAAAASLQVELQAAKAAAAAQREYDRLNADYREESLSDLMGDIG